MTKLLDQAVEAVRYLSPEARDDTAHVVLSLGGADAEPPVPLTPKSRPRLPIQKLLLPVANLRATNKCSRSGRSTVCEITLYPSGACRSQGDPLLHSSPFAAERAAGSGPHQSSRRSSVAESLHRAPPERSDPWSVAPSGANLIFDILTKGRATDAFARRGIATNEEGWALLRNDDLQSSSSGHP